MTEDQIEDQDVELHDDDEEVMEEDYHGGMKKKKMPEAMHGGMKKKKMPEAMGHDPKNAEAQSVASVDKAGDATGSAPKRKMAGGTAGDNTKQDPMIKTKAGMITAMVHKMQKMDKKSLQAMMHYNGTSEEDLDGELVAEEQIEYQADFRDDLNALVADEATLSEEFKEKAEVIFEAAIKSKLGEEIDRLEEKYNEELAEEVESTKAELVEKVDSYLNYVVENWMEENKLAVQTGLRTEIAEKFMNSLKDLFTESYIEVPESKVDLVDEMAAEIEELEEAHNIAVANSLEMQEKVEVLSREKIIREASDDLAETQVEKLKDLVEDIEFEDDETFAKKVATVKESYFTKKVTESADIEEEDDGDAPVVSSDTMAQYLSAIQKTNKN